MQYRGTGKEVRKQKAGPRLMAMATHQAGRDVSGTAGCWSLRDPLTWRGQPGRATVSPEIDKLFPLVRACFTCLLLIILSIP